jgi:hypothetical protein
VVRTEWPGSASARLPGCSGAGRPRRGPRGSRPWRLSRPVPRVGRVSSQRKPRPRGRRTRAGSILPPEPPRGPRTVSRRPPQNSPEARIRCFPGRGQAQRPAGRRSDAPARPEPRPPPQPRRGPSRDAQGSAGPRNAFPLSEPRSRPSQSSPSEHAEAPQKATG